MRVGPIGEFVISRLDLVVDLFDAEHSTVSIGFRYPVPESGAQVEPVVEVLRPDEDIGIEEVGHLWPS